MLVESIVRGVEQAAGIGLLNKLVENIVNKVFEVGENRSTVSLNGGLSSLQ